MAEDSGGLLVEIGVTQARMERELAKLIKDAGNSADQMEKYFKRANDNIGKSAAGAFAGATRGANAAAPAVRDLSGYTANLGANLNDIAVQLAGGQSPFQIMLQQGTQIGQVATQAGVGIKGMGSLLAGAFASAISPVNLLTFAMIGLGGYAVQYFADVASGGDEANSTLEKQQELVQQVVKAWGDAVPALKEYADTLKNAANVADLQAATDIVAKKQFDDIKGSVEALDLQLTDLLLELDRVGEDPTKIQALSESFEALRSKVQEGTATQQDYQAVQDALNATMGSGIPVVAEFAGKFGILAGSIATAAAAAKKARYDLQAITGNFPAHGSGQGGLISGADMTIQGTSDPSLPDNGPAPQSRPPVELEGMSWISKGRSGGGSKSNPYQQEIESLKARTEALRATTEAQAGVNPLINDYGFAMEKAKTEAQLLAEAQKAGMAITPQLKTQISDLATSYAAASVDAKKLAEAQGEIKKRAQEWASTGKDVMGGFLKDLKAGKSGAESLANAIEKLSDKLLDMALNDIFSTSGGGGGGGFIGSLLGGFGKIFGFSSGTGNTGGRRGEPRGVVHGQEAVIPLPAGGKVPVQINSPTVATGKGSSDEVTINLIDDSGRMASIADQRIQTAGGTIVRVAVNQSMRQVKEAMPALMTDAQKRSL